MQLRINQPGEKEIIFSPKDVLMKMIEKNPDIKTYTIRLTSKSLDRLRAKDTERKEKGSRITHGKIKAECHTHASPRP